MAPRAWAVLAITSPQWQACELRGEMSLNTSTAGLGAAATASHRRSIGARLSSRDGVMESTVAVTA